MKKVFDIIRQVWVAATPEEIVRQTWVQRMIETLKFPKELLAVEKQLKTLPHLAKDPNPLPERRIDLLCFMKCADTLKPLLLMECKETLTQETLDQALAYNHYVKAPYVAIASASQIRFRYALSCHLCEIPSLPSFPELTRHLHG